MNCLKLTEKSISLASLSVSPAIAQVSGLRSTQQTVTQPVNKLNHFFLCILFIFRLFETGALKNNSISLLLSGRRIKRRTGQFNRLNLERHLSKSQTITIRHQEHDGRYADIAIHL